VVASYVRFVSSKSSLISIGCGPNFESGTNTTSLNSGSGFQAASKAQFPGLSLASNFDWNEFKLQDYCTECEQIEVHLRQDPVRGGGCELIRSFSDHLRGGKPQRWASPKVNYCPPRANQNVAAPAQGFAKCVSHNLTLVRRNNRPCLLRLPNFSGD